jgi:Short C-terminal domain
VKFDPQNHKGSTLADPPPGARPAKRSKPQATGSHAPAPDLSGPLERLAKRHAAGQLTAEEYEAAKRKLLG